MSDWYPGEEHVEPMGGFSVDRYGGSYSWTYEVRPSWRHRVRRWWRERLGLRGGAPALTKQEPAGSNPVSPSAGGGMESLSPSSPVAGYTVVPIDGTILGEPTLFRTPFRSVGAVALMTPCWMDVLRGMGL